MKLIFAGTSHGVPEADRFCTSTFLLSGENTYMIDAGAPVSSLLRRHGVAHEAVKGVFITHPHDDHVNGLLEFCIQISWYFKNSQRRDFGKLPECAAFKP